MFDSVPVHQIFDDLFQIKLNRKKRGELIKARAIFRANGALAPWMVSEIRKMYRDHHPAVEKMYEARERARISIAKQRMGLSDDRVTSLRDVRISELEDKVNDLGI